MIRISRILAASLAFCCSATIARAAFTVPGFELVYS